MERFAIKIDKNLRSNLYKICRLCGIDNPSKVKILDDANYINLDDSEPELWQKILDCIGFVITKDDKMPQSMCSLCVDKINDFYEFREMCFATNAQTRKLLGLKDEPKKLKKSTELCKKENDVKNIFPPINIPAKRGRKRRSLDASLVETSESQKKTFAVVKRSKGKVSKILPKDEIKEEMTSSAGLTTPSFVDQPTEGLDSKSSPTKGSSKSKHNCFICYEEFANKIQLWRHFKTTHIPCVVYHYCTACNVSLKKNEIETHQLWHKISKTPFQCERCNESFINKYTFSKHLRDCHVVEMSTTPLVLDRQCPQCHDTFVTNFLYNIHPCSVNTRRCGGCNQLCETRDDFLRHSALCSYTITNASHHIATNGKTDTIRIKNENEVEAAADALAAANKESTENSFYANTGSNTVFATTPVDSFSRLGAPVMNENHCVVIPRNINLNDEKKSSPSPVLGKSKKRVTKRDFKRFDELLKSTLTQLSNIKHEPSISDNPAFMTTACSPRSSSPDTLSLFDHNEEANSDDADFDNDPDSGTTPISIKQEIIDEGPKGHYNHNEINIKKEVAIEPKLQGTERLQQTQTENISVGIETSGLTKQSLNRVPILKLKITKEHGTLNSTLVDEMHKGEKKKKKKKRKETIEKEKHIHKEEIFNESATESVYMEKLKSQPDLDKNANESSELEPLPGMLRIKQEQHQEEVDVYVRNDSPTQSDHQRNEEICNHVIVEREQKPSALSIGFEITSVTGGVDLIEEHQIKKEYEENGKSDPEPSTENPYQIKDIKPSREELDSLMKIANLSGGYEMPHNINQNQKVDPLNSDNVLSKKNNNEPTLLNSNTSKSSTTRKRKHQLQNECITPRIMSILSGDEISSIDHQGLVNELNAEQGSFNEFTNIQIKKETVNPEYDLHESSIQKEQESMDLHENYDNFIDDSKNRSYKIDGKQCEFEEKDYIENIDFNNVHIKQEIEIADEIMECGNATLQNRSTVDSTFDEEDDEDAVSSEISSSDEDECEEEEEPLKEYRILQMSSDEDDKKDIPKTEKKNEGGSFSSKICSNFLANQKHLEIQSGQLYKDDSYSKGVTNHHNNARCELQIGLFPSELQSRTKTDTSQKSLQEQPASSPVSTKVEPKNSIKSCNSWENILEKHKSSKFLGEAIENSQDDKKKIDLEVNFTDKHPFNITKTSKSKKLLESITNQLHDDCINKKETEISKIGNVVIAPAFLNTQTLDEKPFCNTTLEAEQDDHSSSQAQSMYGLVIEQSSVCSLAHPFNETEQNSDSACSSQLQANLSNIIAVEEIQNNLNQEMILDRNVVNISCSFDGPSTSASIAGEEPKIINEEIENLINEGADAATTFQANDIVRITSNVSQTLCNEYFNDNINEIAENNNNANIERELQDENESNTIEEQNVVAPAEHIVNNPSNNSAQTKILFSSEK